MRRNFSFWESFTVISTIIGFAVDVVALGEILRRIIFFKIENPGISVSLEELRIPTIAGETRLVEAIIFLILVYTIVGMTHWFNNTDIMGYRWRLLKMRKQLHKAWQDTYFKKGELPPITITLDHERGVIKDEELEREIARRQTFILPYTFLTIIFILPFILIWIWIFVLRGESPLWLNSMILITLGAAVLLKIQIPNQWPFKRYVIVTFLTETPLLVAILLIFTTYSAISIVLIALFIPFLTLVSWAIMGIVLLSLADLHLRSGLLRKGGLIQ
jgi:hypothetical protein